MRVTFWEVIQVEGIVRIQAWEFGITYCTWGKSKLFDEDQGFLNGGSGR